MKNMLGLNTHKTKTKRVSKKRRITAERPTTIHAGGAPVYHLALLGEGRMARGHLRLNIALNICGQLSKNPTG